MGVNRKNTSHIIAAALRSKADGRVHIPNPFTEDMRKAAEHIEWLELVLSGIPVKDRKAIATLKRQIKRDNKKLNRKDNTIRSLKEKLKEQKQSHKEEIEEMKNSFDRQMKHMLAKKVEETEELREAFEKEFIENLMTTKKTKNLNSVAKALKRQLEFERMSYSSTATSNDYGWKYY